MVNNQLFVLFFCCFAYLTLSIVDLESLQRNEIAILQYDSREITNSEKSK